MKRPFRAQERNFGRDFFESDEQWHSWRDKLARRDETALPTLYEQYMVAQFGEEPVRRIGVFNDLIRKLFIFVPVLYLLQTFSMCIGWLTFTFPGSPSISEISQIFAIVTLVIVGLSLLIWTGLGDSSKPRKLLIPLSIAVSSFVLGWWNFSHYQLDSIPFGTVFEVLINTSVTVFPFHLILAILADKFIDRKDPQRERSKKCY